MSKVIFLLTMAIHFSATAEAYKESTPEPVNYSSGQERGAGSGIAAEFHRAMDDFIQIVKNNKDYFDTVNINDLESAQLRVLINYKPITVCNTHAVLDAHSDIENKTIFVNQSEWVHKSWQDKVHIAGHELLLNTGYEKSNQYQLSNQIYKIEKDYLSNKYGNQSLCQITPANCRSYYQTKEAIVNLFSLYKDGKITIGGYSSLLESNKSVLDIIILTSVGIKKRNLERKWYAIDKSGQMMRFKEQLMYAVDNEFEPLYEEAEKLLNNKMSEEVLSCVEL